MIGARRAALRCALAALLALLALAALGPSEAWAEGRTVLFVAPAPSPFSARVRAEIAAMGFDIEESAALITSGTGALAAARVIEHPGRRVELWIADAGTGQLIERAVVLPAANDDEDSQTTRASEQLRALFQPLAARLSPLASPVASPLASPPALAPLPSSPATRLLAAPPRAPSAPPPPPSAPPPLAPPGEIAPPPIPHRPRFLLGADLAVPFQPGGPALDLGLRARWSPLEALGLGAFAGIPLRGSTITAAEGSASLSAALFGLDLSLSAHPVPRLRLAASAGLALAWLRTSGLATPPYTGKATDAFFALPLLGAELSPRLTGSVSLYLDGRIGVALPRADLVFAGRPVASWGRPLGRVAAGVSVDL